ncbi:hypothetical protein CR513_10512, partial [Mucuna pruriens]
MLVYPFSSWKERSTCHYKSSIIGFKLYLGTVLTTLHAGSVVLTIFSNYNVSLKDLTLPTKLQVQVQLTRANQVFEALAATLHHQIIYNEFVKTIFMKPNEASNSETLVIF